MQEAYWSYYSIQRKSVKEALEFSMWNSEQLHADLLVSVRNTLFLSTIFLEHVFFSSFMTHLYFGYI